MDGTVYPLDEPIDISARGRHSIELVVDRLVVRRRQRSRLTDSVEQALAAGRGVMKVLVADRPESATKDNSERELRFSQLFSCDQCGTGYEELTPHHFSFNARMGWCPSCEGLGTQKGAAPSSIAVHPTKSLLDGALVGWPVELVAADDGRLHTLITALARHIGFDPHTPWSRLTEAQQWALLHGCGEDWIDLPGCRRFLVGRSIPVARLLPGD